MGRRCLREPIPQIFAAAELLRSAMHAHCAGNGLLAAKLLKSADMPEVRDWAESILGKTSPEIHRTRVVAGAPPLFEKALRATLRMPSVSEQRVLIAHYGYRCAFCGIPLVRKQVRQRAAKLYPEAVTWGRRNISQHAAFFTMWLQFDHVVPHSRGGDNTFENIVVTCAPCNFGRMSFTLEELGLLDPRTRPIERIDWDGMEQFE
jgi:hypothetical protein